MNNRCTMLYTSVVGSHAWGMDHEESDWDFATIYLAPSDDILLGRDYKRGYNKSGKFEDEVPWDLTFMEIGKHLHLLSNGNISQFVTLLSPPVRYHIGQSIMDEPSKRWKYIVPHACNDTQYRLRKMVMKYPAKNIFHSINGMTTANLKKYFRNRDNGEDARFAWNNYHIYRTGHGADMTFEEWMRLRGKKLAQIERLVQFGFRVLTEQKYELKACKLGDGSLQDEQRVRQWQKDLIHAYNASDLPERPDQEAYDNFLLDMRMDSIIDDHDDELRERYNEPPEY